MNYSSFTIDFVALYKFGCKSARTKGPSSLILTLFLFFCFSFQPAHNQVLESKSQLIKLRSIISNSSDLKVLSDLKSGNFTEIAERRTGFNELNRYSINVVEATRLSAVSSEQFSKYFRTATEYSEHSTDSIFFLWQKINAKIATLEWDILNSTRDSSFYSVAVFSNEGALLFDNILSNLISEVTDSKFVSEFNPVKTDFIEASARVTSLTGSVTLHWRVVFTANVSPYLDPEMNDGCYNLYSKEISCWKTDPYGIPPQGEPVVYFGLHGTAGEDDDPFESSIYIDGNIDHFYSGNYAGKIWDGCGASWTTDYAVNYDNGISISTPSEPETPISLRTLSSFGQALIILDKVYEDTPDKRYRGVFWNNGGMELQNFTIKVEEGGGETGKITANIPVNCAYSFWNAAPIFQDVYFPGSLPISVEYVRAHRIPEPVCSLSAPDTAVFTGQRTTVTVRIANPSAVADIAGGTVSLDANSLGNHFAIIGEASFPLDTIHAGQFIDFPFILEGSLVGTAIPQIQISGQWGYPASEAGKSFHIKILTEQEIEVLPEPSISVISPNGGESLQAGSAHEIKWNSIFTSGNVQVSYSADNGINWIIISDPEPDDGSFLWDVPVLNSTSCLVRVVGCDGTPAGESKSVFTISDVPVVTVVSPNGGEIWETGIHRTILWSSWGTSGNVQISYSIDNGINWINVTENTSDDGSYEWTVPDEYSELCLVRITDANGTVTDRSNSLFTISPIPEIIISQPNGGESWQAGSNQLITWNSSVTSGNVSIFYSVDNGSGWTVLTESTADDGSYSWVIPDSPSLTCLVRVADTNDNPMDQSDLPFTITAIPVINVTSPVGGEVWLSGTSHTISWTSTGTSGNVQILNSIDNGSTWSELTDSTPDDGSFTWIIPDYQSTTCLVIVRDIDGNPSGQSEDVFSLTNICVPVTIESPPTDNEICSKTGYATFRVVADGTPSLVYQWQVRIDEMWINVTDGIPSGALYTNEKSPILEVTGPDSPGIYQYRCQITNCAAVNTTTNVANLIVRAVPSGIVIEPVIQPTCNIPAGSVVLSGLPATGTWTLTQIPDLTEISGSGPNTVLADLLPGTVRYTVTNEWGCTSEKSEPITIEKPDAGVIPKITIKYSDVLICYNLGDSLLSYQWYQNSDPIPNATRQYYQIKNMPGEYFVQTIDINGCKNVSDSIIISGSKSLKAFPNPASESIELKMEDFSEGRAVIRIFNSKGIKVMESELDDINNMLLNRIPISNLEEGIFLVQILINNKESYYTKIVIAR